MRNWINKLLGRTVKQGAAPVHVGATPIIFTDVYPFRGTDKWVFNWRTPDHSQGATDVLPNKETALHMRDLFIKSKGAQARFINEVTKDEAAELAVR